MIEGLLRYARFFSYLIFSSESRKIVFADIKRFYLGQKVINNTTVNPWSDKFYSEEERALALEKAVQWLLHSQDSMTDDGIGSYHLINKWSSSYVETTGYIIPSLLSFGIQTNDNVIIHKATLAADWLIKVQKDSGGWQGECIADNRPEVVFNTGQVIRGLLSVYKYTND
jgi:hypothetical protein